MKNSKFKVCIQFSYNIYLHDKKKVTWNLPLFQTEANRFKKVGLTLLRDTKTTLDLRIFHIVARQRNPAARSYHCTTAALLPLRRSTVTKRIGRALKSSGHRCFPLKRGIFINGCEFRRNSKVESPPEW